MSGKVGVSKDHPFTDESKWGAEAGWDDGDIEFLESGEVDIEICKFYEREETEEEKEKRKKDEEKKAAAGGGPASPRWWY